mgnify:CR=1 FL=1
MVRMVGVRIITDHLEFNKKTSELRVPILLSLLQYISQVALE